MTTRHVDKLWITGGVFGAAVLLALGWFVFIGPQYAAAASLDEQVVQAQLRLTSLQRKLADLRAQNEDLPQYQAELERLRKALPKEAASSDFLRDLQAAATEAGVTVSGLSIGTRADVAGTGGAIFALPVALTVEGPVVGLEGFVNELQQVRARAVLIRSMNLTSDASGITLSLNLDMYVSAPEPDAAAKPAK